MDVLALDPDLDLDDILEDVDLEEKVDDWVAVRSMERSSVRWRE